ncbi:hypothetical protein G7048_13205 [Diaphorobacter sp. HDW4B]|uniref:hypothetical protein n=1 Tax=Diaphorobacter sp. HDW4B TaxID=2714925 RepID=UPI0014087CF2|nr:hypothetical protein [Diaphorobacter sp. HDW4B]QIL71232.1 hypothetical protein G7048_13205 [Diaphorobacter sp. HDW4B]
MGHIQPNPNYIRLNKINLKKAQISTTSIHKALVLKDSELSSVQDARITHPNDEMAPQARRKAADSTFVLAKALQQSMRGHIVISKRATHRGRQGLVSKTKIS